MGNIPCINCIKESVCMFKENFIDMLNNHNEAHKGSPDIFEFKLICKELRGRNVRTEKDSFIKYLDSNREVIGDRES